MIQLVVTKEGGKPFTLDTNMALIETWSESELSDHPCTPELRDTHFQPLPTKSQQCSGIARWQVTDTCGQWWWWGGPREVPGPWDQWTNTATGPTSHLCRVGKQVEKFFGILMKISWKEKKLFKQLVNYIFI